MASAAASLLAVPAVAADDVDAQLAEMKELVKGLQDKVNAQAEQLDQQGKELKEAQRVVHADEPQSKSALSSFIDSLEVDGGVAASYNFNFNQPTNNDSFSVSSGGFGQNSGQSGFYMPGHGDANTFQVDQVWFGLGKPATAESRGGFRFDIFFGAVASTYAQSIGDRRDNGDSTADYAIDQAYVEYLAPVADIDFKLGKFATPVGAEVAKQWSNFNITRGIVYSMLQPVNHMGILATVPLGSMGEFGAGLVNSGGSTISAPDDGSEKSYLATLKLGDNRANIRGTFIYGSEPTIVENFSGAPGHSGNQLGLVDATAWFNPSDKVSLWANYDYLFADETGYYANGVAVAGRVEVLPDLGLAVRGEYVRENHSPGHGQLIFVDSVNPAAGAHDVDAWSVTGTLDYALTDHLKVRSEFRWDLANGNGTATDNGGNGNNQFAENHPNDFSSLDQMVWLIAAEYVF
jgi:hypothetical protein